MVKDRKTSATDELIEQLTVRLGTCPIDQYDVVLAALIEARQRQAKPITTAMLAKQLRLSRERIRQIRLQLGIVPIINQFGAAEFTAEEAALIIKHPRKNGRPRKTSA